MRETVREGIRKPGDGLEEAVVRRQLDRIFGSAEFASSKRCQEFLRYVVDKTLAGHANDLKERTIGIELLGRPSSYEPSTDATVRVKAGDVRKRLHLYYSGQGAADELRVELPAGGYVPEFLPAQHPQTAVPAVPAVPARPRRLWSPLLILAACGLLAATVLFFRWRSPASVRDRFWAPALSASGPVLLCVSPVPVYGLHPDVETGRR